MFTAAVARHLAAQGIGVVFGTSGTNAFLEDLPDAPVRAVAIFSRPDPAGVDGGMGYDQVGAQLLIRGNPADGSRARSGYEWAWQIRAALHGLSGVTIAPGTSDECVVVGCHATQGAPVNIGDDPDDRPRWSVEVRAEVHAPTPLRPLNG